MATITGSFSSNSKNLQPYIVYNYSQSITANTTTITAKLYVKKLTSYGNTYDSSTPYSLTIGGDTVSKGSKSVNMSGVSVGSSVLITSGSKTITHSADGTMKATINGVVDWSGSNPGKGNVSQSVTFPTIPRATTPSVNGTLKFGSTITINHRGTSSSFKHTLKYSFGSATGTIKADATGTSTAWTIPKDLQSQITSSTSGKLTITCITKTGSSEIGTKAISITVVIADDCIPSISSAFFEDAMNKPSTLTGYYQNYSKVRVTVTAGSVYGAKISTYKVKVGSMSELSSSGNVITSGVLSTAGVYNIVITVTDSRGRTVSKTYSSAITATAYTPPSVTNFSYKRTIMENGAESQSNMGTIGYITHSGIIQSNMLTQVRQLKYKPTTISTWTTVNLSNTNQINFKFSDALSGSTAYNLKLIYRDDLSSIERDLVMTNVFPLISLNANGNGLAIGKDSTLENLIDISIPAKITKDFTVNKIYASNLEVSGPANISGRMETTGSMNADVYYTNCLTDTTKKFNLGGFGGSSVYGDTQGVAYLGNCIIIYGNEKFNNIEANKSYASTIKFRVPFNSAPFISVTVNTSTPHTSYAGAVKVSATQFDLSFRRTSATDTTVFWCAIGQRGL